MTTTADCLIEIGTEELPPKALRDLGNAFAELMTSRVDDARLLRGRIESFATPRRLALKIHALAAVQEDRVVEQKGPPVAVAFDDDGTPTRAAKSFADKCGVNVNALQRRATGKGEWLVCNAVEKGRSLEELLPDLVQQALAALPIPRRMRWGARTEEFVRPVHWVVLMHGAKVVPGTVLGIESGDLTYGHRFMAPAPLTLGTADDYPDRLASEGYVLAGFAARRKCIDEGVAALLRTAGEVAVGDDALFDEVTALTEWPVPMVGQFDDDFLTLPREVIVASLTGHQRYFPVADTNGKLLPKFVVVANLDSREPDKVRLGNERVLRPRLADAAFFWATDRRTSLEDRRRLLADVVYQRGLGSMADKSARVAQLCEELAQSLGQGDAATRAALLAKCDLLTGMVGEFPELQGIMGGHYARADGEADAIADAIGEQYLPRYAGDDLPATVAGQILAFADKLDTLCGIFSLGKKPSGNRDPFGLRRAALGIVRIATECALDVNLTQLIAVSMQAQPTAPGEAMAGELYDFIIERMRGLLIERGNATGDEFEAVRGNRPASLMDIEARIRAVRQFSKLDAAGSLAAANKRIANILRQAGHEDAGQADRALLEAGAETALFAALTNMQDDASRLLAERRYGEVLARLAELREPVDAFFDDVMVMAEDSAVRQNRLALLATLRARFLDVADISRLTFDKD